MAKKQIEETAIELTEAIQKESEEKVVQKENKVSIPDPSVKNKKIIAKVPSIFRKSPNLSPEYIVGTMPAGVSFEIVSEYKSRIYGEFYKLGNGLYITKGGLYEIS